VDRGRIFRRGRWAAARCVACVVAAMAVANGAAAAASLTLTTQPAAPVAGMPFSFSIGGTLPAGNGSGSSDWSLDLSVRSAKGPACGTSSFTDEAANAALLSYTWALHGVNAPFTQRQTFAPFGPQPKNSEYWSGELAPGSYRECAWLSDPDATDPSVSIAQASGTLTIATGHYGLRVSGPPTLRLTRDDGHPSPHHVATFTLHVSAPVGHDRVVDVIPEPPGLTRCPAELVKPWKRSGNPVFYRPGHLAYGRPLRAGAHTYRISLGELAYGAARPGPTLVCAQVFDLGPTLPLTVASAHTHIRLLAP
jgi:hypothetical protein